MDSRHTGLLCRIGAPGANIQPLAHQRPREGCETLPWEEVRHVGEAGLYLGTGVNLPGLLSTRRILQEDCNPA